MGKIEILVIGTNQPIARTIAKLIDREGKWQATIAYNLAQAKDLFPTKQFGLVLIGAGLREGEETELKIYINEINPHLPIVKHYGGGSGLLFAEIYQGLRVD